LISDDPIDKKARSFYSRRIVIDHITLPVRDYAVSRRFYEDALRPLGLVWGVYVAQISQVPQEKAVA